MRPISARGFTQASRALTRADGPGARAPGLARPVSARQGYSRPSSYNKAFKATNVALQKANSRDLIAQVCSEIDEIISSCTDDCDALDGLISALTAKTARTGTKIERAVICQSLCAIASRLGRLSGLMWPKILRYISKELQVRNTFEVDCQYMIHLAAVYGAYTKHVLDLTDITVLISLLEELIDKIPVLNKAAGIMALSKVVEEMHSRALFDPMEHGVQLSEHICQLAQRLKKDPDDRALLESSLLLHIIARINPCIINVPPIARKIVTFVTDCHKHNNWKIRETSLRIIESEDLLGNLPSTLVGAILKAAEECRYDRIEAVRTVARSILGFLNAKVEPVKPRTRSAAMARVQSHKTRPKSASIKKPFLDRPSNNNTLVSWVETHNKVSNTVSNTMTGTAIVMTTMLDHSTQSSKAYTYVPINTTTVAAPPFRQSRGSGLALSSTSSTLTDSTISGEYSDSCNKSRHLLKLLEGEHTHSARPSLSTTDSDRSPKAQTAIYCKKLDSTTNSSTSHS